MSAIVTGTGLTKRTITNGTIQSSCVRGARARGRVQTLHNVYICNYYRYVQSDFTVSKGALDSTLTPPGGFIWILLNSYVFN
eukprot:SAG22_NODE_1710_length_3761_cov_2.537957_2_plen_82_part_00